MSNNEPSIAAANDNLHSAQSHTLNETQIRDIDASLKEMFVGTSSSSISSESFRKELQAAREERFGRLA